MIFDFYSDFVALYFSTFLSRCLSLSTLNSLWDNELTLVCTNLCVIFCVHQKLPHHHLTTFLSVCFNYPRFKKQPTELTLPTIFCTYRKLNQSFLIGNVFVVHLFIPSLQKSPRKMCHESRKKLLRRVFVTLDCYKILNDTHFFVMATNTPCPI